MAEVNIRKSRKKTRNPTIHQCSIKKRKLQKGESYITATGKLKNEKIFHEQRFCQRSCKKNCVGKVDIGRQREIFQCFYNLPNWSRKTLFLPTLIKCKAVKENLDPILIQKKRNFFNKYYLSDKSGNQCEVCLSFVVKCLQINQSRIFRAQKTTIFNETACEKRGKYPTKITPADDVSYLKSFIDEFPRYESHYSISNANYQFLSPNFNIQKLYDEYKLVCSKNGRNAVSTWKFRHIFNTEFNLKFKPLKIDTCHTCDKIKAEIQSRTNDNEKEQLLKQKERHLLFAEKARHDISLAIEKGKNPSEKTEVFTFDLQRALELPHLKTNQAYYKRTLAFYNLGIYDEVRKICYMYTWNESLAGRGSQEIASCLYKHFLTFIPAGTLRIELFSDACAGQNRNIKMSVMLKKFFEYSRLELVSIEQRFFVPGHSHNNCDRSFALIEREK